MRGQGNGFARVLARALRTFRHVSGYCLTAMVAPPPVPEILAGWGGRGVFPAGMRGAGRPTRAPAPLERSKLLLTALWERVDGGSGPRVTSGRETRGRDVIRISRAVRKRMGKARCPDFPRGSRDRRVRFPGDFPSARSRRSAGGKGPSLPPPPGETSCGARPRSRPCRYGSVDGGDAGPHRSGGEAVEVGVAGGRQRALPR